MKLTCACGSEIFKSGFVKIGFMGIPCTLDPDDGPQYNETLAEYSFGWDTNEYDRVECRICGKKYDIGFNEDAEMVLNAVRDQ